MDDQNNTSAPVDDATTPLPANPPDSAPAAVEPDSSQPTGSDTTDTPPTAPESPINDPSITPAEDQNQGVNQPLEVATSRDLRPDSDEPEEPISAPNEPEVSVDDQPASPTSEPVIQEPDQTQPQTDFESVPVSPVQIVPSVSAPSTPTAPQPQSSALENQVGFIRSLLNKANAKIQSNKQKKLNEIIQLAQKKQIIKNEDVQKLLHISSATATRYLVKLVQQNHLTRVGSPRDAKYQFVN
jgi:hypothetical protein